MSSDGTIRKRADGRYELQIVTGKTLDGKYTRKSFYGSGPREVKQKRDAWLEKQARHEAVDQHMGFDEWALRWAKTYKHASVSDSTYKAIIRYITNYLIPYFKNARLADIKTADVQNFFNQNMDKSSATLDKLKKELNQIFEAAIDNDLCFKNPCRSIKLPTYKKVLEKRVYTQAQSEKVIEFAKSHPFGMGVLLILSTGIRRGELLALQWEDFDFDRKTITVKQAINASGQISHPKTEAGNRTIPFSNGLREYLEPFRGSGYLISNNNGSYMHPNNWDKRRLKPFMLDMHTQYQDIPILTAHELRHTYGTLLREQGIDIYTIQKVMGHADIQVTADVYVHNDIDVLRKAMHL